MRVAKVIGTVILSRRHESVAGGRFKVAVPLSPDGRGPDGDPFLAVDSLGAGTGEVVIVSSDGKGTREMLKADNTPVRWMTLGIVD